jgi:hypothetical protein
MNATVMNIVEILFWGALALLYFGIHFQYQELLIAVCAGAICANKIVSLLRRGDT